MTTSFAQRQQVLAEKIARGQAQAEALDARCRELDSQILALSDERRQYQLLQAACDALEQMQALGVASLFWGEAVPVPGQEALLRNGRGAFEAFNHTLLGLEQSRAGVLGDLAQQRAQIGDLEYELADVRQAEEDVKFEFAIERDNVPHAFREAVMPWASREEDDRRLRKVLRLALLCMLVIGIMPQLWKLPPVDRNKPVEIPDRLVQMVKKQVPPKPVEKPRELKREKPEDVRTAKKEEIQPRPQEKAVPAQVQQARARAESKGVLAFKDSFSDLIDEGMPSQLGADARISNAGRVSGGAPGHGAAGTRSLIVSQAGGGSGGIANAAVSRGGVGSGGGGAGGAIAGSGLQTTRAQSAIGANLKEAGRPLSKGAGPARTDEEIQIVFDRYKAALYRIYNRELRNDPTLRGKMVLALTIEPDGRVSACRVQSTDMNSPALSADIVERVFKFSFGAKEGVPTTKILYPIDFLPAS